MISAQCRGELGILPAAALIEGALQATGLQEHKSVVHILERVCLLQSPLRELSADPARDWRELVKQAEQWTA